MPEPSRVKVLLDTDIGSDIDDAVCLTYLLAQPACDLLGVTTVSGEVEERAALASAICKVVGRDDVSIRAGLDAPLSGKQLQPRAPQKEALARWDHDTDFAARTAIDFMADTIRAHPGEVVLLSIGPLTNVAALFDAHPDVAGKLGGLTMMAGAFRREGGPGKLNEWNVRCDPTAAAQVYATPVAGHRSVGLNVTVRVRLPRDDVYRRFTHERWQPTLDMAEVWFREYDFMMFHDPLAGAVLFADDILQWNRGTVRVETEGEEPGRTELVLAPDGPHEAASWVDPDRFFDHFLAVTCA